MKPKNRNPPTPAPRAGKRGIHLLNLISRCSCRVSFLSNSPGFPCGREAEHCIGSRVSFSLKRSGKLPSRGWANKIERERGGTGLKKVGLKGGIKREKRRRKRRKVESYRRRTKEERVASSAAAARSPFPADSDVLPPARNGPRNIIRKLRQPAPGIFEFTNGAALFRLGKGGWLDTRRGFLISRASTGKEIDSLLPPSSSSCGRCWWCC